MQHRCIRGRYANGVIPAWEFARDGETLRVRVEGSLVVSIGGAMDLAVESAIQGSGIVYLFETWLQPAFEQRLLEPVLQPWWLSFSGPWLYYHDRRLIPGPLRAFIDFIKQLPA